MMKGHMIAVTIFGCLLASRAVAEDKVRIGVYESRAVAVAFGASEMREAGKKAGDPKIAKAGENMGNKGFGTAPVDDILELIKDLPKLKRQAKITILVSKWDSDTLAKYKSAERVDVTLLLAAEFEPDKRTLQTIWAMQHMHVKPLSHKTIEEAVKKGI